jgi:hypothetical protein
VRTYAKFLALEPSLSSWGTRDRRQSSAWSLRGSRSTLSARLPRALPTVQNERGGADVSGVSKRMFVESECCLLSVLKNSGPIAHVPPRLSAGSTRKSFRVVHHVRDGLQSEIQELYLGNSIVQTLMIMLDVLLPAILRKLVPETCCEFPHVRSVVPLNTNAYHGHVLLVSTWSDLEFGAPRAFSSLQNASKTDFMYPSLQRESAKTSGELFRWDQPAVFQNFTASFSRLPEKRRKLEYGAAISSLFASNQIVDLLIDVRDPDQQSDD